MTHSTIRRRLCLGALAAAPLVLTRPSMAEGDWPARPIRFIVPGPAGSGMDIFSRLISVKLGEALNTAIVVENRPGANSMIGSDFVAKSQPDGYTLLMSPSSAIAINPVLQPKMPYDALTAFIPIAQVGAAGILLVANATTGWHTLADLVAYAKAHPDELAFGSWGNGSSGHLLLEGLNQHYGIAMRHIPFKGNAQLINDMLAKQIQVGFTDVASPVPHIRAGKLVALGCSGTARGPALPEVPTLAEQGYPFNKDGWYGVFAPAGTPMPIVERLNHEINRILATDEVIDKFAVHNMPRPSTLSLAEFGAMVREDSAAWQQLARTANLQMG